MGGALGIDLGTSGLRVAVLDAAGDLVTQAGVPLPTERATEPAAWLEALEAALARVPLDAVRRVAVDGTSGTLLAVDAAGAPVGPTAMYNAPAPAEAVAAIARIAPAGSPARGATSPLAKALAMQARPGVARLLHQADWIAGTLLGRFGHSDENNALKTGYDPVARRWPDWLAATGLDTTLLPEVAVPGTPLGEVAEARFGLPRGALVCAGTTDGCASFLAAGAREAGEGVTVLGSTLTLKLACTRPVAAPDYGIYSHRMGGLWLAGGSSNSGGRALARHFDPAALARLSAGIDPARATGLDYYPLPGPGERFPIADPALAPRETPRPTDDATFLHGLLEGIARIEALGYQRLAALGAPPLRSVRSLGSGAANAAWTAIRARHLGVPMLPARSAEAAVGAALLALRGV